THLDICTGVRLPLGADEPEPEVRPDEDEEFPSLDFFFDTAQSAGVQRIVQIGCDLHAARWTTELVASQYAGDSGAAGVTAAPAVAAAPAAGSALMLGGVALPPKEAPRLAERGLLDDALTENESLVTAHDRMRVVGETVLDSFRTGEEGIAEQQRSFRAHIVDDKRNGKAMQHHDRNDHADELSLLK